MVSKRISRDDYLNKLIAFKDKQLIKVITGIRRCGKSTIMEIYQDYLQKEMNVTKKQIIAINLEDYEQKCELKQLLHQLRKASLRFFFEKIALLLDD